MTQAHTCMACVAELELGTARSGHVPKEADSLKLSGLSRHADTSRSPVTSVMGERLGFMKDAEGIHSQEGIIMAGGFVVTYRFTTPNDKLNGYAYESKPYKTQAEAESYLKAVLARAIAKDVHIIDWQIWHDDQLVE